MQINKSPIIKSSYSIEIKYNNQKTETLNNLESKKIIKNFESLKVSNLLKLVGGNNNYQKRIIILIAICIYLLSFQNYYQTYIFYVPKILCYNKNNLLENCEYNEACEKKNFELFLEKKSLVTKFGLFCEKEYIVALIESLTFFCAAIFSLAFSVISDYMGRRKILILSSFIFLFGNFICFYVESLEFIIFGFILAFSGQDMIASVFYVYFSETMGKKFRNITSGIIFIGFVFGNYSLLFLNLFINDYEDIFLVVFIQSIALTIFCFFFLETPFIFYSKKNLLGLFNNLSKISEINNKPELNLLKKEKLKKKIFLSSSIILKNIKSYKIKKEKQEIKNQKKNFTKNKFKGYKLKIISVSLIMITVYFTSGMFLVAPQNLGVKNLFVNIAVTNLGEISGYIFMIFFSKKFKRIKFFQTYLIIYYILCSLLLFFTLFKIRQYFFIQLLETFISFIINFNMANGSCMIYVYISELFPSNIRGFTIGISILFGRISISLCSLLSFWGNRYDLHPLFFCVIFAIVAQIPVFFLPETFYGEIKN